MRRWRRKAKREATVWPPVEGRRRFLKGLAAAPAALAASSLLKATEDHVPTTTRVPLVTGGSGVTGSAYSDRIEVRNGWGDLVSHYEVPRGESERGQR